MMDYEFDYPISYNNFKKTNKYYISKETIPTREDYYLCITLCNISTKKPLTDKDIKIFFYLLNHLLTNISHKEIRNNLNILYKKFLLKYKDRIMNIKNELANLD